MFCFVLFVKSSWDHWVSYSWASPPLWEFKNVSAIISWSRFLMFLSFWNVCFLISLGHLSCTLWNFLSIIILYPFHRFRSNLDLFLENSWVPLEALYFFFVSYIPIPMPVCHVKEWPLLTVWSSLCRKVFCFVFFFYLHWIYGAGWVDLLAFLWVFSKV